MKHVMESKAVSSINVGKEQPIDLQDAPELNLEEISDDFTLPEDENLGQQVQRQSKEEHEFDSRSQPDSGFISAEEEELPKSDAGEEEGFPSVQSQDPNQTNNAMELPQQNMVKLSDEKDKSASQNFEFTCRCKVKFKKKYEQILSYMQRILGKVIKEFKMKKKFKKHWKMSKEWLNSVHSEDRFYKLVFEAYPVFQGSIDYGQGMKVEFMRLSSFTHVCNFDLPFLNLAKEGFYYDQEKKQVLCFTCNEAFSAEKLEGITKDCRTDFIKHLHKEWCMISDHGNVPVHAQDSTPNNGPPSCNKMAFKDEQGNVVHGRNFCGPNVFFTVIKYILQQYPALKVAFANYKSGHSKFKLILEMLDKGSRNSMRGMVHILQETNMVEALNSRTTEIDLNKFPIIEFVCRLMEKEIEFCRSCSCGSDCTGEEKEQIIISNLDRKNASFQNAVDKSLEVIAKPFCVTCKENIKWTLNGPPPCLFLNVWHMKILSIDQMANIICIMGHQYSLQAVCLHEEVDPKSKQGHFTALIRSSGRWFFYNDSDVEALDRYTARLVETDDKYFGRRNPILAVYCITEASGEV